MTTITELVRLAEAATPGPWGRVGYPYYEYWIVEKHEADATGSRQVHPIASVTHAPCKYEDGWYKNTQRDANAAYIAAADPQTILALVRELAGEREARETLDKALRSKDEAMGVLFKRLAANHIDCSDLIS